MDKQQKWDLIYKILSSTDQTLYQKAILQGFDQVLPENPSPRDIQEHLSKFRNFVSVNNIQNPLSAEAQNQHPVGGGRQYSAKSAE